MRGLPPSSVGSPPAPYQCVRVAVFLFPQAMVYCVNGVEHARYVSGAGGQRGSGAAGRADSHGHSNLLCIRFLLLLRVRACRTLASHDSLPSGWPSPYPSFPPSCCCAAPRREAHPGAVERCAAGLLPGAMTWHGLFVCPAPGSTHTCRHQHAESRLSISASP